ncbi:hypothetical protein NliqN6_2943 [Naganishia liquefaciens]|uniref:Uncharacterized protein n=1 Tax=Naganishia liquefaciens TaxID=104408 RepID=A0A8H3TT89_9TREE|nr:hypothetical protein NliqN6_2943 [Naganishia liquefaciens]
MSHQRPITSTLGALRRKGVPLSHRHYATASKASVGGTSDPGSYCSDFVKKYDPEAWLCHFFWPKDVRDLWLGWRAFNLEIHQVSASAKQPTIAMMRYQFWRDAIKSIWNVSQFINRTRHGPSPDHSLPIYLIKDAPPNHPVALQLHKAKMMRPIQRYHLKQIIDARANALQGPRTHATLQAYIEAQAPLQNALLLGPLPLVLPPTHPATSDISHTLTHISSLLSTTSLLRSLPLNVSKRINTLPRDVCVSHGLVEEELFRNGAGAKGLQDACFQVGTRGMDELITARSHLKNGKVDPKAATPVFLSTVSAERYLKRLEAVDFNPFHPDLQKADWKLAPVIMKTAWTSRL